MILTLTPEERAYLTQLGQVTQQAKQTYEHAHQLFGAAFGAMCAARGLSDATFVSLSDHDLTVTLPEIPDLDPAAPEPNWVPD